jgi:hypothetical protein
MKAATLSRVATTAAALLALLAPQAGAKPKSIGFGPVVERAEVIAVARFPGPWQPRPGDHSVMLEFTRVIKGDIRLGKYRAVYSDQPHIDDPSREFVAFLGKGLCWRFAAQPVSGQSLAKGLLWVTGFNDYNAYWVNPSLLTLAQIEGFVKHGKLAYTFRGPSVSPSGGGPTGSRASWRSRPATTRLSGGRWSRASPGSRTSPAPRKCLPGVTPNKQASG